MSDMDAETTALSPEADAFIENLLRRPKPGTPDAAVSPLETLLRRQEAAPPDAPGATALVRYLCNALPSPEARQVELELTASTAARSALREARRLLTRFQKLSWSEVADAEKGDTWEAEIAQAWLALAAQPLKSITPNAPETPQPVEADIWTELKRRARSGAVQARELWNAFHAFGAQVHTQLQRPMPALTRGDSQILPVQGGRQGEVELTTAHIDAAGVLHVSAGMVSPSGQPLADFTGQTAYLALRAGREILLCSAAPLTAGQISWSVAEVGGILGSRSAEFSAQGLVILIAQEGLPLLSLPALRFLSQDLFAEGFLVASTEIVSETKEVVGQLTANILTAEGAESSLTPVRLDVIGVPDALHGALQLTMRLPETVRVAYAADHAVLFDLAVAPGEWQRLGSRPLAHWGPTAQTLSIPCPGLVDGPLASLTQLRVYLVPLGVEV